MHNKNSCNVLLSTFILLIYRLKYQNSRFECLCLAIDSLRKLLYDNLLQKNSTICKHSGKSKVVSILSPTW